MSTILILHDPAGPHEPLAGTFRQQGYDTVEGSSAQAMSLIVTTHPDVVLLDVDVADPECPDLLDRLHSDRRCSAPPIVVLTGVADTCCIWQTRRLAAKERWVTAAFSASEALHQVREYTRERGLR